MSMDISLWEQKFQELIREKKPQARWTLKLNGKLQPDCVAPGWKQYQQNAFGRFQCSSCSRKWASAKVQVLCHMYQEPPKSQGQVLMRLFAQRCKKCLGSQFEKPEFSSENTMRILHNLVQRILDRFYRTRDWTAHDLPVIIEVPLEGSHDIANCEACFLGFCVMRSMTEPLTNPPSNQKFGNFSTTTGDIVVQNRARNHLAEARLHPAQDLRAHGQTVGQTSTVPTFHLDPLAPSSSGHEKVVA
ncbi:PREDICTED: receptor-transporting protein 4 [Elephantulus edwardii]|uniref:receptor-transporting protein 4 n=1 Tax=Elephantulus edwardii TaxID=28737 RepID=UPI0003F086C7|nr:PREDICTED: receptor-transporting protein 4 [Elephantulus edwardii]